MARAIDSEAAYRFLSEQLVKETGAFSKGVNKGLNIARSAMRNPDAIPTLRPVSRERVEKVFGGKWEEETYTTVSGRGRVIHSKKYTCSVCGKANGRAKTNFCPHCGASQTDEAVEMVMERLEALKDGN